MNLSQMALLCFEFVLTDSELSRLAEVRKVMQPSLDHRASFYTMFPDLDTLPMLQRFNA